MNALNERYLINSVVRAIQVLEAFSLEKPEYTNAEFSRKLGLPKGTLTRLLASLEKGGLIRKDTETARYRLTYKIHQMGQIALHQSNLYFEAYPLLKEMVAEINETAHLAVMDHDQVLYLEQIQCTQPVGIISIAGSRLPAYCTATGKALLADLDEKNLDRLFKGKTLIKHSPNTIVDIGELKEHLRQVRVQGYALARAEYRNDILSIAVPIYDKHGKAIASISAAGPMYRMSRPDMIDRVIPAVKRTGALISQRMGFMPP